MTVSLIHSDLMTCIRGEGEKSSGSVRKMYVSGMSTEVKRAMRNLRCFSRIIMFSLM